jgi:hypothetical protein
VRRLSPSNQIPRVVSPSSSATPSFNIDNADIVDITGLAATVTSMTSSMTGTPFHGQKLLFRFKDNGTARPITWGASFLSSGSGTLLATTVISKQHSVLTVYDSTVSKHVCLAADATGYEMSIALVQSASGNSGAGYVNTLGVTWPGNTTTGNLLVASVAISGVNSVSGITDSQSNTWTKITGTSNTTDASTLELWYAKNITGGTTPTVTVSPTAGAFAQWGVVIREFSGLDKASPLDQSGYAPLDSYVEAQDSPTTSTTAVANELVIGATVGNNHAATFTSAGTGFGATILQATPSIDFLASANHYKIVASTGTYTSSMTSDQYMTGGAAIATFKAATINFVQSRVGGYTTGNNSSFTLAPTTANITLGNTLILGVWFNNNTTHPPTVSDSAGNTWTLATNLVSGAYGVALYYAPITAGGGTKPTITVTFFTANSDNGTGLLYEYAGLSATPLDVFASGNQTGVTAIVSPSTATTAQASELVVGVTIARASSGTETLTAGSGFGNLISQSFGAGSNLSQRLGMESLVVGTVGTQAATFTASLSASTGTIVATFKAAGGAPAVNSAFFALF